MSQAIQILRHEHDVILAAINLLDSMTQQMSSEQAVESDDVVQLISVLSEFAEKCHHGKEEDLLFPALVKAGLSKDAGALALMLQEHETARSLMRDMQTASRAPLHVSDFASAAEGYSTTLRNHIEKENELLFPMAEETLTQTQLNALTDAFEEHEQKIIGPGRHDELYGIIKRLQKRYLM